MRVCEGETRPRFASVLTAGSVCSRTGMRERVGIEGSGPPRSLTLRWQLNELQHITFGIDHILGHSTLELPSLVGR